MCLFQILTVNFYKGPQKYKLLAQNIFKFFLFIISSNTTITASLSSSPQLPNSLQRPSDPTPYNHCHHVLHHHHLSLIQLTITGHHPAFGVSIAGQPTSLDYTSNLKLSSISRSADFFPINSSWFKPASDVFFSKTQNRPALICTNCHTAAEGHFCGRYSGQSQG